MVFATAVALSLGAAERGAAEPVTGCAGKPLCVTITDQAQASRTPGSIDHYMSDTVRVYYDSGTGATSNLVNIVVTVTWADVGADTTSEYASSDPDCTESEAHTLTCTTPKSMRPGDSLTYDLVFRTATDAAATATLVTVEAGAKELTKPNKGGSNTAFVRVSNPTPYEGSLELDISTAGDGISTLLATAAGVGQQFQQFSELPVPEGAPRGLFTVEEQDLGGSVGCPAGLNCFGQQVTTTGNTGALPANLWITYTGDLPPGTSESGLVVVHDRSSNIPPDPATIGAACSGELFSGQAPPSSEIPCRRVRITHLPGGNGIIEVDAWDIGHGRWIGGG